MVELVRPPMMVTPMGARKSELAPRLTVVGCYFKHDQIAQ
jgi:hypothetical protein